MYAAFKNDAPKVQAFLNYCKDGYFSLVNFLCLMFESAKVLMGQVKKTGDTLHCNKRNNEKMAPEDLCCLLLDITSEKSLFTSQFCLLV